MFWLASRMDRFNNCFGNVNEQQIGAVVVESGMVYLNRGFDRITSKVCDSI